MRWCVPNFKYCVWGVSVDVGPRAGDKPGLHRDSLSQKPNQANALWTFLVSASKLWCLWKVYTVILAALVIQSPPFLADTMLGIKPRALRTLGTQSTYWAPPPFLTVKSLSVCFSAEQWSWGLRMPGECSL